MDYTEYYANRAYSLYYRSAASSLIGAYLTLNMLHLCYPGLINTDHVTLVISLNEQQVDCCPISSNKCPVNVAYLSEKKTPHRSTLML